ncbi:putative hemagglutinin protein [Vibrio phage 199E37-1]|nr:putative hemagglutinin protein [Vibrio phage 199E37-1]
MSSNLIQQPYPIILNPHGGGGSAKPAANAEYHVGEIGKDPVQYPRTDLAYKDEESGEERLITSPIYTNNSGAFVASENSGTIINPYMKDGLGYSVLIKGRRGTIYESKAVGDPGNLDKKISELTNITYNSISDLVGGVPVEAEKHFNVTTSDNGYTLNWIIVESEINDRYCLSLDNGLFARLDTPKVELSGLGVSSGDDISSHMEKLAKATNVRKIKSSGLERVQMSKFAQFERNDFLLKLHVVEWTGDYNLYPDKEPDRQVAIITVRGSRELVQASTITSEIKEGDATYTVDTATGLVEGGFAVLIGGAKYNYLTRVEKIDGNKVTLDYSAGWDESANIVKIYAATPIINPNVMIDSIVDKSGSLLTKNLITGVSFLDTFKGSLRVDNAYDMANPVGLTRRAHSLNIPYMDSHNPRLDGAGQGYTLQLNGSTFCHTGIIKGSNVRHSIDWTRSAYCTADVIYGTETTGVAVTTHGAYEHDITVNEIHTSKGCAGTLFVANAGSQFGERTKRFKVNKRVIINGQVDFQNAEDIEINGAVLQESVSVRINSDCVLNQCDFSACTSFRVRSRADRDQLSVVLNGGNYPNIEFQNFTGTLRADNSIMKWFVNQDTSVIPKSIKTVNCVHDITDPLVLSLNQTLSLSSAYIKVPEIFSSIGVIVECPKLIITSADCENSPVISHDSTVAKTFTINGLVDVNPNSERTAAIIRCRKVNGLVVNLSGVISKAGGSGKIVEMGRNDNANITLQMANNHLNGDMAITEFGSVVKSTIVGNAVKNLSNLPANDASNGVVANIQI